MDTDKEKIHSEETYEIIGCAMRVHNTLGHGFHEKAYENALVVEFKKNSIPFKQQPNYPILYEGETVAEFRPDIVVFDKIVVDTKTIDRITDRERGQILNYLKVTGLKVGLVINFKHPKLDWDRKIL